MATGNVDVLHDARVYVGAYDLSGQANQVTASASANMLDATSFDSGGWTETRPGLVSGVVTVQTYLDESIAGTDLDPGGSALVSTITTDDAEFSEGYALSGYAATLGKEGAVGDLFASPITLQGSGHAFHGELLMPKAAQSSAGSGTGRQLGAVSADESVYGALHVFAVTGGSVTVLVESDDGAGFASATSRISFAAASSVGAQFLSTSGAITDDYWRVRWTQTASSATFAVLVGIQ